MHALRALWTMDSPTYEGRFVSFRDAYMRPKPVRGTVPFIIGGHSKAAARRAGRMAEGFFPARGASPELLALVRQSAIEAGREPDAVEITASMPEDISLLPEMAKAGISRILVPVTGVAGLKQIIRGPEDLKNWTDIIDRHAAL